jgi:hypothetical protein
MKQYLYLFVLALGSVCTATAISCIRSKPEITGKVQPEIASPLALTPVTQPDQYWFQGKAELAVYDVEQERYGEMRPAEQVTIFVTEDFSKKKQVKLDNPSAAGDDRVPVFKANIVRKYPTGIYDYSMMQSVFTPLEGGATIKTTCTVQDWCGHVFSQFNLQPDGSYRAREFSYFESESDTDQNIKGAILEDGLWTQVHLDPNKIPTGAVSIVPAAFYLRMRHQPYAAVAGEITRTTEQNKLNITLQIPTLGRKMTWICETAAPYRLLSWEELDRGKLMSKGTLKALRLEPYWSQNSNQYAGMRDSLGLKY